MNNIVINIAGKTFDGWKALEISQGIEQLCGSFAMRYSDRYTNNTSDHSFTIGDSCTIDINNHRLLTGYIEEIESEYSESSHDLQVRGRDKLGDLIDCCHWGQKYQQEFISQSVLSIVKKLCSPFGIEVIADATATSAVAKKMGDEENPFKPNEGDTILDTLVRICKINALLPVTYGDGKLYLTRGRATVSKTSLKRGVNIKSGTLSQSNIDRFSDYIVKAVQTEDGETAVEEGGPQGYKKDKSITRHRPTVILTEEAIDNGTANNIANWEAVRRAGKSIEYQYTVTGWLKDDGAPWMINEQIPVYDPYHRLFNNNLLCTKVSFTMGENDSSLTILTLMHSDAYKLEAIPEKIDSDWGF